MKNVLISGLLMYMTIVGGQDYDDQFYMISFDDTTEMHRLIIDSLSNEYNIWQIGMPSKSFFSSSNSGSKAIMTDTLNSYPINDTSSFIFFHVAGHGFVDNGDAFLRGMYKVDCDSIKDFGTIEFSTDLGEHWIDPLSPDQSDYINVYNRPILTGKQDWSAFGISFSGYPWSISYGDTILFKFSFISDNISDDRDGLMFDDLSCTDWVEGVELNGIDIFSSTAYPNPADSKITILSEVDDGVELNLQIFDFSGRFIEKREGQFGKELELGIDAYLPGVYFYVLENREDYRRSTGKFVVK